MKFKLLIIFLYFLEPSFGCFRGFDNSFAPFEIYDPLAGPLEHELYPIVERPPQVIEEPVLAPFSVGSNNVCGDLPKLCTAAKCRRRVLCSRRCQRIQDDCTNPDPLHREIENPTIYVETEEYHQKLDSLNGVPQEVRDLLSIGNFGQNLPSPNVDFGQNFPSSNVDFGQNFPSPNVDFGQNFPSPNVDFGQNLLPSNDGLGNSIGVIPSRIQYQIPKSQEYKEPEQSKESSLSASPRLESDDYYWLTRDAFEKQSRDIADNQYSASQPHSSSEINDSTSKVEVVEDEEALQPSIQLDATTNLINDYEARMKESVAYNNPVLRDENRQIQLGPEDLASILESIGAGIDNIPAYNLDNVNHRSRSKI